MNESNEELALDDMLQKMQRADQLSRQVISYARNTLFVHLRFMENALSRLVFVPYGGTIATDMCRLYYNSQFILPDFQKNDKTLTHRYLHIILHCIFRHAYVGPAIRRPVWNLACDIAVEQMIQELHLKCIDDDYGNAQRGILQELQSQLKYMTAEKIYHYYITQNISDAQCEQLREAFALDEHEIWYTSGNGSSGSQGDSDFDSQGNDSSDSQGGSDSDSQGDDSSDSQGNGNQKSDSDSSQSQNNENSTAAMTHAEAQEVWKKLAKQIQTDLETFQKQQGTGGGSLLQNLEAVNRERYDYAEFLRKFAVYGEIMKIDDDEFDYNFYTYGMNLYGNMPLIEPLEYKEVKRVRDFVIAIDTSGSVSGETVQKFVNKTYNILKQQDSFFTKVNIYIIQCDAEIQEVQKITSQEEFEQYMKTMQLHGFGGTDFRPVFAYVDELIRQHAFTNLKGMLYFTDGFGDFPEHQPDYQTAFVFLDDDYNNYQVPVWAIRLILTTEEIEQ